MKTLKLLFLMVLFSGLASAVHSQDCKVNARYSYYTTESRAEILVVVPEAEVGKTIKIKIRLNSSDVYLSDTLAHARLVSVFVPLDNLPVGNHLLSALITGTGKPVEVQSTLVRLPPKKNGVRIDRRTGALIANGLPWFPFGFYCYSPIQPTLAEEEAVKGFNLMSPYQRIDPATIRDREIYMDRCARLGMKVHYQLISMAGGGGVGSSRSGGISPGQKLSRLRQEVEHFRDHPALLAWYLSDEPTGNGVSPDSLQKMYDFVRELDPYHPITIVFDAPQRAREYADAMDIVMADPYPIPNSAVAGVGSVTEALHKSFEYEKPVWIVPQAFGGGEWWGREPSPQEIRVMTYLSLVRGATGIQYFIRQGLNGFPKSTVTWGECSKVALEVAEMTPYLLEGTPLTELTKEKGGLWTNGWKLGDETLIMAVNSKNEPREIEIDLPAGKSLASAEVLFENRQLKIAGKQILDWIGPYGTQVYRIAPATKEPDGPNLISDPGFENMLSYGVPAMCYAHVGSDRGATAFLDPRTQVSGHHSLRLVTPESGKGIGLSFFPVSLNSGQSYRFSISAKADTLSWLPGRKLTFFQRLLGKKEIPSRNFQLKIGDLARLSKAPTGEWQPYGLYFTVPENSDGQVKVNPYLELSGQGTAWFDDMVLTEDPVITYSMPPKKKHPEILLSTGTPDAVIRYNLDGRKPIPADPEYIDPIVLTKTRSVAAGIFRDQTLLAWTVQSFKLHLAVGHAPAYEKKYSADYPGGGAMGLVDGQFGSRNFRDGKWQGFNGQDLRAIIDLDSVQQVRKVTIGFFQDISAWIFMPLKVEVEFSSDGKNFSAAGSVENKVDEHATGSIRKDFTVEFNPVPARYIRVKATSRKTCPDWHNGKGKPAYIFADEISVE